MQAGKEYADFLDLGGREEAAGEGEAIARELGGQGTG
jgi:hypothetical protein